MTEWLSLGLCVCGCQLHYFTFVLAIDEACLGQQIEVEWSAREDYTEVWGRTLHTLEFGVAETSYIPQILRTHIPLWHRIIT